MLIRMSGFEQFSQGVNESLLDLSLDGLRDFMKQTWAHETKLKQPQNGAKLSPKATLRNKKNKTKENHKKGGHLQR